MQAVQHLNAIFLEYLMCVATWKAAMLNRKDWNGNICSQLPNDIKLVSDTNLS